MLKDLDTRYLMIEQLKHFINDTATMSEKTLAKKLLDDVSKNTKNIKKGMIKMKENMIDQFMSSYQLTAVEHTQFQSFGDQPTHYTDAAPTEYIDYYITTIRDQIDEMDHLTPQKIADGYNLDQLDLDTPFLQIDFKNSGDSTNAPSMYLDDIKDDDNLLVLINEALNNDQVTHWSGLKPRHQLHKSVYKVIVQDHGDTIQEASFLDFNGLKSWLIEQSEDLFGWIQEQEPEKPLPNFKDDQTVNSLIQTLKDYDYSWYTVSIIDA